MPTARTSVGNEEYEYKWKEELAGDGQQTVGRRWTVAIGILAVAVALRHESTLRQPVLSRQQFHVKVFKYDVWTPRSPYEIAPEMAALKPGMRASPGYR